VKLYEGFKRREKNEKDFIDQLNRVTNFLSVALVILFFVVVAVQIYLATTR